MATKRRSEVPLTTVPVHGARGYDLGCGCLQCKRGQNERLKRYRDRKAAGTVGTAVVRVPAHAGKFERGVLSMVQEMDVDSAEAQLLVDMMVFNAQLLDSIPENGRWHLASSAQKTIRDLRDELHKLGASKPTPSAAGDLDGFLGGLTKQG